jgi:hypothetical protein
LAQIKQTITLELVIVSQLADWGYFIIGNYLSQLINAYLPLAKAEIPHLPDLTTPGPSWETGGDSNAFKIRIQTKNSFYDND